MAESNYAFVKDSTVINVVVFDTPSDELLTIFKDEFNLDSIIPVDGPVFIGGTYDGTKFWPIQPFPSWVKDASTTTWQAPTPKLTSEDNEVYIWNENTLSWIPSTNPLLS